MRPSPRWMFAGLAIAVCVLAAPTASGSPPTGDAEAIAFYRDVARAYTRVPAVSYRRTGYLSYSLSGTVFRYSYGQKRPPGLHPAAESIVVLLAHGVIVKSVDTAKASGLVPLTIIGDASGVWAKTAVNPCFYAQGRTGSNPVNRGKPFVDPENDSFEPLQRSGAFVTVRTSYPWGSSVAHEVDRVSATTKLVISSTARVGPSVFSSRATYQVIAKPTTFPAALPHC